MDSTRREGKIREEEEGQEMERGRREGKNKGDRQGGVDFAPLQKFLRAPMSACIAQTELRHILHSHICTDESSLVDKYQDDRKKSIQ